MRVFAKKSYEFKRYETKNGQKVAAEKVATSPLSFCDLPDWVAEDRMFQWARSSGNIEILASKADEKLAEQKASAGKKGNKEKSEKLTS
ncbi:MAG TPA: hypothetical protein DCZ10_16150 [Pelotomaculum sp.]|nr:hypothetical protein [Pelotomaculum sp.]